MIFVNRLTWASGPDMTGDNVIRESQLTITPAGQIDQSLANYLSDIFPYRVSSSDSTHYRTQLKISIKVSSLSSYEEDKYLVIISLLSKLLYAKYSRSITS